MCIFRFALIMLLASVSYHLIEYPSQLLAQRIFRFLAARDEKGSGGGLSRDEPPLDPPTALVVPFPDPLVGDMFKVLVHARRILVALAGMERILPRSVRKMD
ncbi:hypothetical protein PHYPSEUDO_014764 [Phytophthora pseudosyringae]|uniref:Secreted protein n=1 Tax=Phytophthora pseudosyringae TaxID=221518 RepID=A0A8T1V6S7_9STRA|nr:hypothetical protein PHYPSEUDO_014764 [Phytophthora pseudosyringae]